MRIQENASVRNFLPICERSVSLGTSLSVQFGSDRQSCQHGLCLASAGRQHDGRGLEFLAHGEVGGDHVKRSDLRRAQAGMPRPLRPPHENRTGSPRSGSTLSGVSAVAAWPRRAYPRQARCPSANRRDHHLPSRSRLANRSAADVHPCGAMRDRYGPVSSTRIRS